MDTADAAILIRHHLITFITFITFITVILITHHSSLITHLTYRLTIHYEIHRNQSLLTCRSSFACVPIRLFAVAHTTPRKAAAKCATAGELSCTGAVDWVHTLDPYA